ncbi:succinate dehydrogenase assembly factor 2 [Lysobacter sp. N42]|uniref:FAD assembly factor SdhE n=1 Tax=Lysobacter sp. N42 TaxID=2545719 RepID=UPI0010496970|nr:succinate dehydrogenase assembly factor 2 [Lysobacter sp. N42]TCZ88963.1 succinate dehydrogenase assembly factor 2 family protein [Lysobacter sp. N42]
MSEAELRALRWRCRRGMRELDQLLERWLERGWPQVSEHERGVFRRLLDVEDPRLWRAFLGQEPLDDAELQQMVDAIARLPH